MSIENTVPTPTENTVQEETFDLEFLNNPSGRISKLLEPYMDKDKVKKPKKYSEKTNKMITTISKQFLEFVAPRIDTPFEELVVDFIHSFGDNIHTIKSKIWGVCKFFETLGAIPEFIRNLYTQIAQLDTKQRLQQKEVIDITWDEVLEMRDSGNLPLDELLAVSMFTMIPPLRKSEWDAVIGKSTVNNYVEDNKLHIIKTKTTPRIVDLPPELVAQFPTSGGIIPKYNKTITQLHRTFFERFELHPKMPTHIFRHIFVSSHPVERKNLKIMGHTRGTALMDYTHPTPTSGTSDSENDNENDNECNKYNLNARLTALEAVVESLRKLIDPVEQ